MRLESVVQNSKIKFKDYYSGDVIQNNNNIDIKLMFQYKCKRLNYDKIRKGNWNIVLYNSLIITAKNSE